MQSHIKDPMITIIRKCTTFLVSLNLLLLGVRCHPDLSLLTSRQNSEIVTVKCRFSVMWGRGYEYVCGKGGGVVGNTWEPVVSK